MQYKKLYEHGKNGPDTFDCAGLVWYIYNEICNINLYYEGFGLSTTTKIMTSKYGKLTLFKENDINKDLNLIKNGDIVFFHRQSLKDNIPTENNKYPGHCGIYLGEQKFIHASMPKQRVVISDFSKNEYWLQVLVGSKDIFYNFEQENFVFEKETISKQLLSKMEI
ncbi:MAG: C40 family peptidase [Bacilli bacterium]|nr:C40 family peptidase [Bacilli bacterium]